MTLLLILKEQTIIIRQGNIILQELTMVSSWQPEKKKKKNEGLDPTSKGRELCQQTMSMEEDLYEPCMRLQSWMIS